MQRIINTAVLLPFTFSMEQMTNSNYGVLTTDTVHRR